MNRKFYYLLLFCFLTNFAFSQTVKVSGKVSDNEGLLPGVSITEKGMPTNVVLTKADGTYSLSLKGTSKIIIVKYLGFKTQEIKVTQAVQNIMLEVENAKLDEVVVIGYGTVRKSDLTGSVSKIKLENAAEQTSSSFEQLIQGKSSGVNITQSSGDPGSGIIFNIRGGNSLGENQPLIVLDGYPIESDNGSTFAKTGAEYWTTEQKPGNVLASLNPNDIESIEILKDASSTAIYGSRGANGVVMITTKRGRDGKDRISYNYRFDMSNLPKKIDVLNSFDFAAYANEASNTSGRTAAFDSTALANLKYNNWQDLIYQTSYSQDHQASLTGGDFKTKYALVINHTDVNGIVKYTNYTKNGVSLNLDRQFSNKFKIGISSKVNLTSNNAGYQSTNHTFVGGGVVTGALRWSPTSTLEDENGDLILSTGNRGNPLANLEKSINVTKNNSILTNLYAEYLILKNLKFKATGGFNQNAVEYRSYWGRGTSTGDSNNGQAYQANNNSFNYLTEYTLNYNTTVAKKHKISALGGYTNQNWRSTSNGVTVRGFPNDNLSYNALQYGSNILAPVSSYREWALSSYLGRFNYTYNNRYLITLTGRSDGSSRLSTNNKWSFFPSVALAWNLHNEKFFKNEIVSQAKIKTSYGISGNQNIGIGATQALFGISRSANTLGSVLTGVALTSFDNPNLHWETTRQLNIGLDLGFVNNKYSLTVDYYNKTTSDLLVNLAIPADNGFLSYNTNLGEIQNNGLEFEADATLINEKFKWIISANISFNRNKVISLGENSMIMGKNLLPTGLDQIGSVAKPGYAIGSFFGYKIDGIYQNAAEVAAGPIDPVLPAPGDIRYKDLNGDGKISPDDRTILGSPNPKYTYGITNNFNYKNFDLTIFVMGKEGSSVLNLNRFYSDGLVYSASGNPRQEAYTNRWLGEGTSNYYPRAKANGSLLDKRVSDMIVENASFLRLKNINLSYSLKLKNQKVISGLKVFANVTNLLTVSGYKGYDPEVSGLGTSALNSNVDFGTIPQYRTFSMGLNVGF
jgi:TonB-linked SusC/RagA family outer membrane protein